MVLYLQRIGPHYGGGRERVRTAIPAAGVREHRRRGPPLRGDRPGGGLRPRLHTQVRGRLQVRDTNGRAAVRHRQRGCDTQHRAPRLRALPQLHPQRRRLRLRHEAVGPGHGHHQGNYMIRARADD
jgi:hypothetical protein